MDFLTTASSVKVSGQLQQPLRTGNGNVGANLAISGCTTLSHSLADDFTELSIVKSHGFVVLISTLSVIVPVR